MDKADKLTAKRENALAKVKGDHLNHLHSSMDYFRNL
jgi:hypothetical protein